MKILLPSTVDVPALDGHEVATYDVASPVPAEHRDAEVLVLFGQRRHQVKEDVPQMPRLRLVQSLAAGAEPVLGLPLPAEVARATGVGLHGTVVGEHAVAMALALLRRVPAATSAQREHRWASELGGVRPLQPVDGPVESLRGANVVTWGHGDIGAAIARYVAPYGAHVTGVARTAGVRDGVEVVTDVDALLPTCDVLFMAIPGGDATRHALDERRLGLLRPGRTFVVNVGRGTSIDQAALEAALRDGRLAGAALDVTDPEPLPVDSTLWDAPNLLLTPHSAGGRVVGFPEFLAHQLAHLDDGELRNRVEG